MPGLFRTGSKPSSTVIWLAPYSSVVDFNAERARALGASIRLVSLTKLLPLRFPGGRELPLLVKDETAPPPSDKGATKDIFQAAHINIAIRQRPAAPEKPVIALIGCSD